MDGRSAYFEEHQLFNQWWFLLLMAGINAMLLYGIVQQVILGRPFGDNPTGDGVLVEITIGVWLLTFLLFSIRLDTRIDPNGIAYRFFPFHRNYTAIDWSRIRHAQVRQYSPILEYGGWGWRYSLGNGSAVNMSANQGLQIEYDDNKKLLIGTRRASALRDALTSLQPQHNLA